MTKKLIGIASEIVQAQVSLPAMSAAEITSSLRQVFNTLHELQKAEPGEIALSETQKKEYLREPSFRTPISACRSPLAIRARKVYIGT